MEEDCGSDEPMDHVKQVGHILRNGSFLEPARQTCHHGIRWPHECKDCEAATSEQEIALWAEDQDDGAAARRTRESRADRYQEQAERYDR